MSGDGRPACLHRESLRVRPSHMNHYLRNLSRTRLCAICINMLDVCDEHTAGVIIANNHSRGFLKMVEVLAYVITGSCKSDWDAN